VGHFADSGYWRIQVMQNQVESITFSDNSSDPLPGLRHRLIFHVQTT
jgi:hypothetical protein